MVFACGTGRTLIALRTVEAVDTRLLLVWCWAQAARADGRREPLMAMSSLEVRKHPVPAEAGAVSTGSGEHLAYWLAQGAKKNESATVSVTLDSLPRIEEVQHSVFPAAVFVLATWMRHTAPRAAGTRDWTVFHGSSRVRTKRRLYLTATPYEWEAPLAGAPDARPCPERTS
ncbi:hypothetical protein [Streptomyces sp. NBC_01012]|uniref:hypothetical protein n=1 Tax=Streptomyces sp. NBC_01012 TaxID=2903717 RepID=UPI003862DE01|nr:hypothetical protein OG623_00020 [Streptomyces sp. NBC_01012]WSV72340.1 hypothetical protein OG623_34485 [Streptomyces sp. NBC_01012]